MFTSIIQYLGMKKTCELNIDTCLTLCPKGSYKWGLNNEIKEFLCLMNQQQKPSAILFHWMILIWAKLNI